MSSVCKLFFRSYSLFMTMHLFATLSCNIVIFCILINAAFSCRCCCVHRLPHSHCLKCIIYPHCDKLIEKKFYTFGEIVLDCWTLHAFNITLTKINLRNSIFCPLVSFTQFLDCYCSTVMYFLLS